MTNGNKNGGKTDILLVNDNKAETAQVLSVLRKAKVINRIHVLEHGGEILEFLFRRGRFEKEVPLPPETLILLSLKLQGMTGIDVLRRIKSDERSRAFPIIVLTGSQEDRGVMEAYKLGANAAMVHPIDITKFIEAVAELRLGWLLITPGDHEA
jgi:two-component system, response regulator